MNYSWWREEVKGNPNQASYDYDVLKEHKLKPCHGRKKFGKIWGREREKDGVREERRESKVFLSTLERESKWKMNDFGTKSK
jgi:hypothetical protein